MPGVLALHDGYLFTIDSGTNQVLVFSETGRLIRTIGREGPGPGEFPGPFNLDVRGNLLAVSAGLGRVSFLDTLGTFSHSFVAAGVSQAGGNLAILNDSLLVISGYRAGEEWYTGTMVHIYTVTGELVRDMLWLSEGEKEFESMSLTGARGDLNWKGESFRCVQIQEYTLYHYDFGGDLLDSLRVNSRTIVR
ncbi:MAG: 6-bladed beta-propeller [Bacteroidota bacterium]|nr:6-bladed beta-propeller [Bacteroidota bacterium]